MEEDSMRQVDFYREVVCSEERCVAYLRGKGLLLGGEGENGFCTREKEGVVCGGRLKDYMRKTRKGAYSKSLRCSKKGCQTYVSIRRSNRFFTYTDLNGRCSSSLSIAQIMELVWMWAHSYSPNLVVDLTGRTRSTVLAWYNLCREVCDLMFQLRERMGGEGEVVEVLDHFYNDKRREENGPWILGIYSKSPSKVVETRFFLLERKDEATLLPLIQEEVHLGTTLHTHNTPLYRKLNEIGYIHEIGRGSRSGTDGEMSKRTKTLDRLWAALRGKFEPRSNGANNLKLQLREEWWRSKNPNHIFASFLNDMKTVYCKDEYDECVSSLLTPSSQIPSTS